MVFWLCPLLPFNSCSRFWYRKCVQTVHVSDKFHLRPTFNSPVFKFQMFSWDQKNTILDCFSTVCWRYAPELWSNSLETLTSNAMQGNVASMWQCLHYSSKTLETEQENWYFAPFLEVFRGLHCLTTYELRPNIVPRSHEGIQLW